MRGTLWELNLSHFENMYILAPQTLCYADFGVTEADLGDHKRASINWVAPLNKICYNTSLRGK